jgi:hypothetical protein
MKSYMIPFLLLACATLGNALASDVPTLDAAKVRLQDELEAAKLQYQHQGNRLLQAHKENVERLALQLLQENDPEGALEAKVVLKRLEEDPAGSVEDVKNPKVLAALEWQQTRKQNIENDYTRIRRPILSRYQEGANVMMRRSVEANQLDDAIAWKTWRDALAAEIAQLPAEIPTAAPNEDTLLPGGTKRQLVLYNQHNGDAKNRGTKTVNILLTFKDKSVWKLENQETKWRENRAEVTRFDLPNLQYDKIRIEIVEWHGSGGGFSEIQIVDTNKNILKDEMISASGQLDERFPKKNLTDGILHSKELFKGYWLLPNGQKGWVDIVL